MTDATQADREAAGDIVVMSGGNGELAAMIRAGEYDGHRSLAVATRHRIASERALIDFLTELDDEGITLRAAVAIWENRT